MQDRRVARARAAARRPPRARAAAGSPPRECSPPSRRRSRAGRGRGRRRAAGCGGTRAAGRAAPPSRSVRVRRARAACLSGRRRWSRRSRCQGDIAYSYAAARTQPAGSRSTATSGQRCHARWKARSTDSWARARRPVSRYAWRTRPGAAVRVQRVEGLGAGWTGRGSPGVVSAGVLAAGSCRARSRPAPARSRRGSSPAPCRPGPAVPGRRRLSARGRPPAPGSAVGRRALGVGSPVLGPGRSAPGASFGCPSEPWRAALRSGGSVAAPRPRLPEEGLAPMPGLFRSGAGRRSRFRFRAGSRVRVRSVSSLAYTYACARGGRAARSPRTGSVAFVTPTGGAISCSLIDFASRSLRRSLGTGQRSARTGACPCSGS